MRDEAKMIRAAIHEAAHAVLALAVGAGVHEVFIGEDGDAGGCWISSDGTLPAIDRAALALAGHAGESMLLNRVGRVNAPQVNASPEHPKDSDRVLLAFRDAGGGDAEALLLFRQAAAMRAVELVDEHVGLIELIARHLLRWRRISGDDLAGITGEGLGSPQRGAVQRVGSGQNSRKCSS